jgi:cation diffusion facilitator family transporter
VALVIWGSAVFAGVASYHKLVGLGTTTHVGIGMVAAAIGIVANQAVARYKAKVGRRIQSATLVADAHHSWLDAISSFGALVGLVAVAFGFPLGDPIAGFAITLFIAHVGYEVTRDVLHHLMDGIEPGLLEQARAAAEAVPGVLDAELTGRWSGRTLHLDVAGRLDPSSSVAEAACIGDAVQTAVLHAVDEAREVCFIPKAA